MPDKGGGGGGGAGGGGSAGSGSTGVSTRLGLIPNLSDPRLITPASFNSLGSVLGAANAAPTLVGTTWPTANLAIFVPFFLAKTETVRKCFTYNGAAVSGNVDIGIYRDDGAGSIDRLVSNGGTAQSGTSQLQALTLVQQLDLAQGQYYLAVSCDNAVATMAYWTVSTAYWQAVGMAQMAAAYPLPKTATLAALGQDFMPFVGAAFRDLVA